MSLTNIYQDDSYIRKVKEVVYKSVTVSDDGCWVWKGQGTRYCYLRVRMGTTGVYEQVGVHRLLFILCKGPIPSNMVVRHLCHNKYCVNPEHLELGTQKQNYADNVSNKGHSLYGKKLLTKADIEDIKDRYYRLKHKQWQIAAAYGVSQVTISKAINDKIKPVN